MNYSNKKSIRTKLKINQIFNTFKYVIAFSLDNNLAVVCKQLEISRTKFFICSNKVLCNYLQLTKINSISTSIKGNILLVFSNSFPNFLQIMPNKLFIFTSSRFIPFLLKNNIVENKKGCFDFTLFPIFAFRLINIVKKIK